MIEVSSTEAVNEFQRLLNKVERGETVRIQKQGRVLARIVPHCDFMSGEAAARLFEGYEATALDKAAGDAVEAVIAELDAEAAGRTPPLPPRKGEQSRAKADLRAFLSDRFCISRASNQFRTQKHAI